MQTASLPKYERVKRTLIRQIEAGRWSAGDAFPSEYQLLEQFDVSRPTLVRSLQALVNEGYLYRRQGKGTFVAARHKTAEGVASASFTVFMSRDVAEITGDSRQVPLRIMRGIQDGLGGDAASLSVRQAGVNAIDAATRSFIESSAPSVALIIEPGFCPTLRLLLEERGWIVWSINEPVEHGHCVYIDQEQAGYLATKFLIDEGRRRIALINGPVTNYWGFAARLNGYRRALREADLPEDPALIREGVHVIDSEAGRQMMRDLLASGVTVDGVVGASDSKAIGAIAATLEARLAIPEQIAFVSIDNTLADRAIPPLPAVAMPFEEMGYQAATQARRAIERGFRRDRSHTRISLRPTLVER